MLEKLNQNFSKIATGIGIVCLLASILFAYFKYESFQDDLIKMNADIIELQDVLEDAKKSSDVISVDEAEEAVNSVKSVGDKIASWQNEYYVMLVQLSNMAEDDAKADDIINKMSNMAENFDEFFGKDSAYRTFWYDGVLAFNNNPVWKFMTYYEFQGDKISVLWEMNDSQGNVYAYMTGDYHVSSNSFDNLKLSKTQYGCQFNNATGTEEETESEDENLDDYANEITSMSDSLDSGIDYELTEEEQKALEEAHNARLELRDQMEKDGE